MAETQNNQDQTPEQAEADLAQLEQAVIEGGDVTVDQLTQAKERVSFAKLKQMGRDARAAAKRVSEAAATRKAAKLEARDIIGNVPDELLEEFDAAVDALQNLVDCAEKYNSRIDEVYRVFSRGGVPVLGWDRSIPPQHDNANTASISQGEQVGSVTVEGDLHVPAIPAEWARQAIIRVARANSGLNFASGASIERMMGEAHRAPLLLAERDKSAQ